MRQVVLSYNTNDDVTVIVDGNYLIIQDNEDRVFIHKDMLSDFLDAILQAEEEMFGDI